MSLAIFSAAFIIQLVGHRIGDYLFQTDWQAQNKAKNKEARARHVLVYSLTISLLMLVTFTPAVAIFVFAITFLEHFWIDSRKPIIAWKTFLETKIARQKGFDISAMPFFVLIEIDQTVHYLRILIISILIGYGMV